MWWRYVLVAIVLAWALFPVMFLVSAALNPAGTLSTSALIPTKFSTANFETSSATSRGPTRRGTRTR